jgi:hypothetical protein
VKIITGHFKIIKAAPWYKIRKAISYKIIYRKDFKLIIKSRVHKALHSSDQTAKKEKRV